MSTPSWAEPWQRRPTTVAGVGLVALDLPGGPAFVDALRRVWDARRRRVSRRPAPPRPGPWPPADGHRAVGADRTATATSTASTAGGRSRPATRSSSPRADRPATPRASCSPTTRCGRRRWRRARRLGVGAGRPLAGLPAARPRRRALRRHPRARHRHRPDRAPGVRRRRRGRRRGGRGDARVARGHRARAASTRRCSGGSCSAGPRPRPTGRRTWWRPTAPTETGSGVVYDGHAARRRRRAPSPTTARSASADRCCCAPTATAPSPLDADGWFPTGDLGAWRDDGRLHVHGRRGDLIITGGENVWPEPVEARPATTPGRRRRAGDGGPRRRVGAAVVAVVVPADASSPPTLEDLRGAVKEVLPAYCAPRRLELVAAIPRTALGKPRRQVVDGAPKP